MRHKAILLLMRTGWGFEMVLIGYGVGWIVTSLFAQAWITAVVALAFTVWRYKRLYDRVNVEDHP
jgi:hypothetical protein